MLRKIHFAIHTLLLARGLVESGGPEYRHGVKSVWGQARHSSNRLCGSVDKRNESPALAGPWPAASGQPPAQHQASARSNRDCKSRPRAISHTAPVIGARDGWLRAIKPIARVSCGNSGRACTRFSRSKKLSRLCGTTLNRPDSLTCAYSEKSESVSRITFG